MRTETYQKYKEPFNLKKRLGYGLDGDAYLDEFGKVVKISFFYDYDSNIEKRYDTVKKSIHYIMENNPAGFVKINSFKELESGYRDFIFDNEKVRQKYYIFCYTMNKGQELNSDERKLFHALLRGDDFSENYKEIVKEFSYLKFNTKKVYDFIESLKKCPIQHIDLGTNNIMRFGANYKLIDIDRVKIKE